MEPGRDIAIDRFGGPTAWFAGVLLRVGPLAGSVGDRSRLSHVGKTEAGYSASFSLERRVKVIESLNLSHPPAPPSLRHVQFVSECLKRDALQKGQDVANARVIHWGVDADRLQMTEKPEQLKRLLFVGQVTRHKGVHTAVEALNLLVQSGHETATLTIVGDSAAKDFQAQLRRMISSYQLEKHVQFTGLVQREDTPRIYREHDVLIFPSVWDEPFSITVLEAMASGLAVVGTATGGSGEILEDGVNALIFEKENAEQCAGCIARLFSDQQLFEQVRRRGRCTIEQKHRLEQMVDTIEIHYNPSTDDADNLCDRGCLGIPIEGQYLQ